MKLKEFVNQDELSYQDKINIINDWVEDIGSDSEYILDLCDKEESEIFINLYGTFYYNKCKQKCRFWMCGSNYYANERQKESFQCKIFAVTQKYLKNSFNSYLDEIEDRFEKYMDINDNTLNDAIYFARYYHHRIDFPSFYVLSNDQRLMIVNGQYFEIVEQD